jgi:16S rRNA (guanine(966)-N(2))-methyltransferase RsmD
MRVISGTARGTRLKRVPGDTTRPIMDRVKENLFNIIGADLVQDRHWLDLFAGTGQVGIEALSRGAAHVTFIDNARAAIKTVQENLAATRCGDRATVRHSDAFSFLESATTPFDLIFIAPPQYRGIWVGALTAIDLRIDRLLTPSGLVIAQIDPREEQELSLRHLVPESRRTYGNTTLLFYERAEAH